MLSPQVSWHAEHTLHLRVMIRQKSKHYILNQTHSLLVSRLFTRRQGCFHTLSEVSADTTKQGL